MLGRFIARGRTAEIYEWDENRVLKLFYDFIPVESIQKEFTKTVMVASMTDLCPKVYERVTLKEGEGIIYEDIEGKSITYHLLNSPLKVKEYSKTLAECQKSINAIPGDGFPDIKECMEISIRKSTILDQHLREKVLKILESLPDGNQLCHMDFHPDKVLLDKVGPRIIDWMNAGKGDSMADVARTVVLLRYSSAPFQNLLFRGVVKLSREILIREYLEAYFHGKDEFEVELDRWILAVAASRTGERLPESEITRLAGFLREELSETK